MYKAKSIFNHHGPLIYLNYVNIAWARINKTKLKIFANQQMQAQRISIEEFNPRSRYFEIKQDL